MTLLDALEHAHDQKALLDEIHRTLKPGGRLVLTVLQQYIFSFLDQGNFKYRFSRLHKFWYQRKHAAEEYDYRYVNNPFGLIGDIEKEKAWHQHFRQGELRALLEQSNFKVVEMDGCCLLNDPLLVLQYLGLKVPAKFWYWQEHKFQSRMLLCLARKA